MSPGKKTVFGETSRKPDWTVKPETSTSTSVTETTEELDLPVAQPDVQVGPDDTSDLSNKDGGPDKLSELEAVSTVYLGTVEGRRIQAARLDVLKPSAGHNVDDHNEQHAAPVYLRVQYKPASSENLDQAAGTVKRTRRDTSDDDDMDDNDNDDMDDDDDDDDNDDDNDDDVIISISILSKPKKPQYFIRIKLASPNQHHYLIPIKPASVHYLTQNQHQYPHKSESVANLHKKPSSVSFPH